MQNKKYIWLFAGCFHSAICLLNFLIELVPHYAERKWNYLMFYICTLAPTIFALGPPPSLLHSWWHAPLCWPVGLVFTLYGSPARNCDWFVWHFARPFIFVMVSLRLARMWARMWRRRAHWLRPLGVNVMTDGKWESKWNSMARLMKYFYALYAEVLNNILEHFNYN